MLVFHPLPQPTSCASTTLSWTFNGPLDPMMLQVTNIGVDKDAPPPPMTTTFSPTSVWESEESIFFL
jgi:hypothetical protein